MPSQQQLAEIVGAENVLHDQATLGLYSRDMSFAHAVRPHCIVKPQNADEVQRLVKWANETRTPLVPVSSGPPHFRGDTISSVGGAVIVDLSAMKRIVRIDRRNRVALIEPGVTFGELIPAVAAEGLRLNMPLLPRRAKSAVGSMLEREPAVMPKYQWDISDPLACMEVIFGTGDLFRTGAAAGPGTLEEQWAAGGSQKEPGGPGQVSWHRVVQGAQGTMGVVTWTSLRCELLPSLESPFLVGSADLGKLFEMVHWLVRLRLVSECFILNDVNLAAIVSANRAAVRQASREELRAGLPPWTLLFNIAAYEYLPEERIAYQTRDMLDIAQRVGLEPKEAVGRVSADELLKIAQRPSVEPYWKCFKGNSEDVLFLTQYGKLPAQLAAMQDAADAAGYPASEVGIYLQPIAQGSGCHCEFNIFYDPNSATEAERVKKLSTDLTMDLMARGAFFSRPYGAPASSIVNRQADSVDILKRVKSILDPNNIMNPGKLGL